MRIYSPSAEVQGHGPGQEVLQTGKREVEVTALEPIGNYAVLPRFSDGHETGIFSWDYLYFLGSQQDELWQKYEERLAKAGVDRDAPMGGAAAALVVRPLALSGAAPCDERHPLRLQHRRRAAPRPSACAASSIRWRRSTTS